MREAAQVVLWACVIAALPIYVIATHLLTTPAGGASR